MEERVKRRSAMKRSVAQTETPNGEIDLIGRALPSSVERHSKILRDVRNGAQKLQAVPIHA